MPFPERKKDPWYPVVILSHELDRHAVKPWTVEIWTPQHRPCCRLARNLVVQHRRRLLRNSHPETSKSPGSIFSNDLGPGNALTITIEHEAVTEVFAGFGEKGVSAETVAKGAAERARSYLAAPVVAGRHLADQLIRPRALAVINGAQRGLFGAARLTPAGPPAQCRRRSTRPDGRVSIRRCAPHPCGAAGAMPPAFNSAGRPS
jgi:hypothetical protein